MPSSQAFRKREPGLRFALRARWRARPGKLRLAEELGCSLKVLRRLIREEGLPSNQPSVPPRKFPLPTDFALYGRRETVDALTERYEVSRSTVRRWRKQVFGGRVSRTTLTQ